MDDSLTVDVVFSTEDTSLESTQSEAAEPPADAAADCVMYLQLIFVLLVVWFMLYVFRGIRSLFSRIGG